MGVQKEGGIAMWQLLRKELLHIVRDKGLLIFVLYAFSFDIYTAAQGFSIIPEKVSVSVYDEDNSLKSRELIHRIQPPVFRTPERAFHRRDVDTLLNESKTVLVLVIPEGFERDVYRNGASVQILVDGTQSAAAYLSSAYLQFIIGQYSEDLARERMKTAKVTGLPSLVVKSRVYFNPEIKDQIFEGINELFHVITLIGMILPASILIREKEYGTLEQIMISPLDIRKLLFMKIVAASVFLLTIIGLCYEFVLKLWLGFPLKGSLAEFLFICLVYSLATSGLAFIIASISKRLSQIGLLTIVIFAPMMLLSGGWVPPEALPDWLRRLTVISPLKYFMGLGVGLLIRGAHMDLLVGDLLKLLLLGALFIAVGYLLYVKRVLKEG
jgi:ABC-2 type transport system permease protein